MVWFNVSCSQMFWADVGFKFERDLDEAMDSCADWWRVHYGVVCAHVAWIRSTGQPKYVTALLCNHLHSFMDSMYPNKYWLFHQDYTPFHQIKLVWEAIWRTLMNNVAIRFPNQVIMGCGREVYLCTKIQHLQISKSRIAWLNISPGDFWSLAELVPH